MQTFTLLLRCEMKRGVEVIAKSPCLIDAEHAEANAITENSHANKTYPL